jgi:hypothetical protein
MIANQVGLSATALRIVMRVARPRASPCAPSWKPPRTTDGYTRGEVRLYVGYARASRRTVAGATDEHDREPHKRHPYLVVLTTEIDYFTQE